MKVDVRFRGLERSDALRDRAVRRIHVHLGRFGQEIRSVVVRVGDVNGPRGGVDKACRVTVRGPRVGTHTVEEHHDDAYAAVDVAVGRIGHAVARELARTRTRRPRRLALALALGRLS